MPFKSGEAVTWTYRSGTGHGYVLHKVGKDKDQEYDIRQVDKHKGEPSVVRHHESNMRHTTRQVVQNAKKEAKKKNN